jgi:hypothetical protein
MVSIRSLVVAAVFAVLATSTAFAQDVEGGGRSLQAARKPTSPKTYTGTKCTSNFGQCNKCTAKRCVTCYTNAWLPPKSKKCACKKGYKVKGKTCAKVAKPTKKPTKKATKKMTKKPTRKPSSTKPVPIAVQPDVKDPVAKKAKVLSANCSGASAGGLTFTVLGKKNYAFSKAAAACKAAGMTLVDLSTVYDGNSPSPGKALQSTVSKCLGSSYMAWFDTTLTKPDCNAFMQTPAPTDAGAATGRKLKAAAAVLMTLEVPSGCSASLPVICFKKAASG